MSVVGEMGSADPVSFVSSKRGGADSTVRLPDFSDDEFDEVKYINEHFPNEQSLANIDDVIDELERKISAYDDNLQKVRALQCHNSCSEWEALVWLNLEHKPVNLTILTYSCRCFFPTHQFVYSKSLV